MDATAARSPPCTSLILPGEGPETIEPFAMNGGTMPQGGARYHAMDSLRASMMFLGLVIHVALSYTTWDTGWNYKDPATHLGFDVAVFWIHLFRMPVFFLVAGFFAMMLMGRGLRSMVRNRFQRILIPFALFWVVVFPITRMGDAFAGHAGEPNALAAAWSSLTSVFDHPRTMHLWFLYYLSMYLTVFLVGAALLRNREWTWLRWWTEAIWTRRRGPLLPAMVTAAIFYALSDRVLPVSNSFAPDLSVFLGYGVFFAFGVMLYRSRARLTEVGRYPWLYLTVGMSATAISIVGYLNPDLFPDPLDALAGGVAIWYLCFAAFALFHRYANSHSRAWRYLSDSSYWVYLIHMPLTIWLPPLLHDWAAPALVKMVLVLSATTAICLISYHFLVRFTLLGVLLNGRRRERHPSREPMPNLNEVSPVGCAHS